MRSADRRGLSALVAYGHLVDPNRAESLPQPRSQVGQGFECMVYPVRRDVDHVAENIPAVPSYEWSAESDDPACERIAAGRS